MTNEEIDALIAKLQEEKEKNQKAIKEEKVLWPATSEVNARFSAFSKKHGIIPTEDERRSIVKIPENLEKRLRNKDPKYRYNAINPEKKKCGRTKKDNGDNDLFQRTKK